MSNGCVILTFNGYTGGSWGPSFTSSRL